MKSLSWLILAATIIMTSSCGLLDSKTPRAYFETAALSCNMFSGFAGKDFDNYLKYQPVMYNPETKKTDTISFEKNIQNNLLLPIDGFFAKVKALKATEETKPMIDASMDLYNYALPKYKNDFMAIAKMKDKNRPKEEVDKALNDFVKNYSDEFKIKYSKFLDISLAFAKKNNIEVKTF